MIRCPRCGESYYAERFGMTTAMYFPIIMKDGVNINPNRNITTVSCQCIACGANFTYQKRGDNIDSITLDGSVLNDLGSKYDFDTTSLGNLEELRL